MQITLIISKQKATKKKIIKIAKTKTKTKTKTKQNETNTKKR